MKCRYLPFIFLSVLGSILLRTSLVQAASTITLIDRVVVQTPTDVLEGALVGDEVNPATASVSYPRLVVGRGFFSQSYLLRTHEGVAEQICEKYFHKKVLRERYEDSFFHSLFPVRLALTYEDGQYFLTSDSRFTEALYVSRIECEHPPLGGE